MTFNYFGELGKLVYPHFTASGRFSDPEIKGCINHLLVWDFIILEEKSNK